MGQEKQERLRKINSPTKREGEGRSESGRSTHLLSSRVNPLAKKQKQ